MYKYGDNIALVYIADTKNTKHVAIVIMHMLKCKRYSENKGLSYNHDK